MLRNLCTVFLTITCHLLFSMQSQAADIQELSQSSPAMIRIPGKNYEISKYEVTQAEWKSVMGNNPSKFSQCGDNCPVEQVSWDDVQIFLQKLAEKTGKEYRLPTNAEWEYVCLGGEATDYCGGNDLDAIAWYDENSNGTTHPVGQLQPNGFGLYDMSGNVNELVNDCNNDGCDYYTVRGGSWLFILNSMEATARSVIKPELRFRGTGFRLARTL